MGDGVLAAAAIGGASSLGLVAKAGGAALAKLAGRAGEDVEVSASHEAQGAACGLSFAASTLVATPSGERPIATLKVGDQVIAVDPTAGKASVQTVQQVFLNHDTDLLNVTLRTTTHAAPKAAAKTAFPALDAAHKQRQAALASHGSHAPPASATTTSTTAESDETIHTTANHPWLSADRGWIVAGQLHLGEPVLRADGSTAEVVALTTVHGSAPMWDLTVSQVHDFAVGNGAYVVHNCARVKNDVFERYGNEGVAKNAEATNALENKRTAAGIPHRNEKWIADPERVNPRTLGKPDNYRYKMTIETRPGTREWLTSEGFESKSNEPGRYGIPWNRLEEFNQRIVRIRIQRIH